MSHRETFCIYDKSHTVPVSDKSGYSTNRCINVTVTDFLDHQQIKLRDASDFVFNYTATVDRRVFESMRIEQSLDINFEEFKTNLVDMLNQVQRQEMYLKCDVLDDEAKLVFYGKSKIKSILFLVIQLKITNQREIFDEMNNTIAELQTINKNLAAQLQINKRLLRDRDLEIEQFAVCSKELEKRFLGDLQKLSYLFATQLQECSTKLLAKILALTQRLLKLIRDVQIVKTESRLKADSSARLLDSMENLRLESIETSRLIADLKRENCSLKAQQQSQEKLIGDLRGQIDRESGDLLKIQEERDEFERDVKQAAIIIAQKTTANEELARDLMQANQMLVNFNHLFETKNKEIEELKKTIALKDQAVFEQNARFQELSRDFEEYKSKYNQENVGKLNQELYNAHKRIEEVEKLNRDTCKLNELLTRKLSSGDFQRHY